MDNWRVLDFTSFTGELHYQRGQLVTLRDDGERQIVPLADVATVLLGLRVAVAPAVLHQLAAFDVITLICDWNGTPSAAMNSWSDHTRIGARHKAQFEVSIPRKKNAWKQIVRAKIAGQAANLKVLGHKDWDKIQAMVPLVHSGDPDNVEARAAGYYWRRLFDGDKFSRVPRGEEARNGMLDYGYAVLRGFGIRSVLAAGLSPSLGVFHRNRSNAFNLVDDVIEPFRPAIDYVVATTPGEMSLAHPSVKHRLVRASTQPFGSDGLSVAAVLTDLAQQLGRYMEGDVEKLSVRSWPGPTKDSA